MAETDEQLYSRFLARGDSADLGVLLERHGESLTLFLYGCVRSMEDAEELMLDALPDRVAALFFAQNRA